MLELSSWLVIGIIYNISHCYLYKKLNNDEFNFNTRLILSCIIIAIINTVVFVNLDWLLNIVIKYIIIVFMIKYIYNDPIDKIFISTLLIYILFSVGEMLFAVTFIKILKVDVDFFKDNCVGIILTNFIILTYSYLLLLTKIKILLKNIVSWYINKKAINILFVSILSIIIIFNFIYQNYYNPLYKANGVMIYIFYSAMIIFIVGYFKDKSDNNKLILKYDQLIDYVKVYEEEIDEKNKRQHEYKNQLILIMEMLDGRNKKAKDYIEKQLELENEIEEYNSVNKLKNLPNVGLKGLIHYKMLEMKKKKIKIYLDINENVSNNRIKKYLNAYLQDISKIFGVLLDNAIDAAVEGNDKYIIIEISKQKDNLELSISNTYKGPIIINSMDKEGYSKKGKNRGYGLSLLKDIINKRNDILISREFNGIYFVQNVYFKYKK